MEERNAEQLFMQLVIQNKKMAMISLGKVKNPVSDTFNKNLDYAKLSIDTLDMLVNKTKGNLSDYEEKLLSETINQLKIIYIEETAIEEKPNKES